MKVIGLAAIINFDDTREEWYYYDTSFANRFADYLILYEATDSSFVALDSMRIDNVSPSHYYAMERYSRLQYYGIREVYFTKPYTVHDSFYISLTSNNNFFYTDETGQSHPYYNYPIQILTLWNSFEGVVDNDPWDSYPGYIKGKARVLPSTGDSSRLNWYWHPNPYHNCLFPIFDTTGMWRPDAPTDDSCYAVAGLRVVGIGNNRATLTWEVAHGQNAWEIAYGTTGTAPDNCSIMHQDNANFTTLPSLDTAQWYVAYIRADCDTVGYSDWSDSVRFYIPSDTTGVKPDDTTGVFIADLAPQERHTTLFPNPAQTHCTVFSSFHISHVELFSLQGQRLLMQPVQGLSTEINIANLPQGNYVVAIHTAAGRAIKILTKR